MKILLSILTFFFFGLSVNAEDKILLIAADDLSKDWISAYKSVHKTPIIDRLAENGLRFSTHWQSAKDKVNAEKNFFTGSYKGKGIPFPVLLKRAGYKTFYLGEANSKTLLKSESSIKHAGFESWSINAGKTANLKMENLHETVLKVMNQPGKVFTFVRFSSNSLKSKAEYGKYLDEIEDFLKSVDSLLSKSSNCTVIFTAISGTEIHEKINLQLDKKSVRNPFANNKKFKPEAFAVKDKDICLPLIVKSPLIPQTGLFTRDLVDTTDIGTTILDLAGIKLKQINGISLKPVISGSLDPRQKRNWIFCDAGKDKAIRSWEYVYYASDRIYGVQFDPDQKMNLLVGKNNNKIYAGERVRLKMIYEREFLGIKPKKNELIKIETLQK